MPKSIFIGIPVLNRLDLLRKCLDRIDLPAHVLIVNNNAHDEGFNERMLYAAGRRGLDLRNQERNLGVAASWNFIIREGMRMGHELIFIGSNDTLLRPGALESVVAYHKTDNEVSWHINGWNFFAIHARAVERVGWFDENFYPAYKEDQDYNYRCDHLAGAKRVAGPCFGRAEHLGSQTIRSNPDYLALNDRTSRWNRDFYIRKWGGDAGCEQFTTPFGRADKDWRWWPDPGASIADRCWHAEHRTR